MSSHLFPTSEPLPLGHMELIVSYRQNPSNRQPLTYVPFTFLLYRKPALYRAWSPQQALQVMGISLPALLLPLGLGGVALFHSAASTATVDKRFLKRPCSKYFRLCGPCSLSQLLNNAITQEQPATENMQMSGHVYLPTKTHL